MFDNLQSRIFNALKSQEVDEEASNPSSDFMTARFSEEFLGMLKVHHALYGPELVYERHFELLFKNAAEEDGRKVSLPEAMNHSGEDMTVDFEKLSLKTEKNGKRNSLTLGKFMCAAWLGDTKDREERRPEIVSNVKTNMLDHLAKYKRVLVLRSFLNNESYEYQLIEISKDVLTKVDYLTEDNFINAKGKKQWTAEVCGDFKLRVDFSSRKIWVADFKLKNRFKSNVIWHGVWKIPRII